MFCKIGGFVGKRCLVVLELGLGWVGYYHIVVG